MRRMGDSQCFRLGAQLVVGWLWFKTYLQLNVKDVDAPCEAGKCMRCVKLRSTFAVLILSPFATSHSSSVK